jgi:uncharacterized protein (UPF0548 family)
MGEWRFARSWSNDALKQRAERLTAAQLNFDASEDEMTLDAGWQHFYSEAVIAHQPEAPEAFERARAALANYQFSDPAIVLAHFDPSTPLPGRRMLLEVKVLGFHYLCPAIVTGVRDEPDVFGFSYSTLDGHIERGIEWFLLLRDGRGDIRFRVEARWRRGDFPNWWTRIGFAALSGHYQRTWHRRAHARMSLLAYHGSLDPPRRDASGLTHQGVDVTFTYPHD